MIEAMEPFAYDPPFPPSYRTITGSKVEAREDGIAPAFFLHVSSALEKARSRSIPRRPGELKASGTLSLFILDGKTSGPILLYSHGSASDAGEIMDMMNAAREALGVTVVCYDPSGFGTSSVLPSFLSSPSFTSFHPSFLSSFPLLPSSLFVPSSISFLDILPLYSFLPSFLPSFIYFFLPSFLHLFSFLQKGKSSLQNFARDLEVVVQYLEDHEAVDISHDLVLWGHSLGVYASIHFAAEKRVLGLVLSAPLISMFHCLSAMDLDRDFHKSAFSPCCVFGAGDVCTNLLASCRIQTKTLIIHAEHDEVCLWLVHLCMPASKN
jgi:pimeloyl-ACP methyl ester carboxylesterase